MDPNAVPAIADIVGVSGHSQWARSEVRGIVSASGTFSGRGPSHGRERGDRDTVDDAGAAEQLPTKPIIPRAELHISPCNCHLAVATLASNHGRADGLMRMGPRGWKLQERNS